MTDGSNGDQFNQLQPFSVENLLWYADRLDDARAALMQIGQTADQQVTSGSESWKGPWRDGFVSTWNRYLTLDPSANQGVYSQMRQQMQAADVPSYMMYEAQGSAGMFQALCDALKSVADQLRGVVATNKRNTSDISKILLTGSLALGVLAATIATAGLASPLFAGLIFIGSTAAAGVGSQVGDQVIDLQYGPKGTNGPYEPTDVFTAWSHVDWAKAGEAGAVAGLEAIVITAVTLGLAPVVETMGAFGRVLLTVAVAAAGFTGDVGGQELTALIATGRLGPVDFGEAGTVAVEAAIFPAVAEGGSALLKGDLPTFRVSGVVEGTDGPSTRTFTGWVTRGGELLVDTGDGGVNPVAATLSMPTDAEGRAFAAFTIGETPVRVTSIDFATTNAAGRFVGTDTGWTLQSVATTVEGRVVWFPVETGSPLPAGLTADLGGFAVPKGWAVGVDLQSGAVRLTQPASGEDPATTWVFKAAEDGSLSLSAGFRTADGTPLAMVVRPAGAIGPELVTLDVREAGLTTPDVTLTVMGRDGVRYIAFGSQETIKVFGPDGRYLGEDPMVGQGSLEVVSRGVAVDPVALVLDGKLTPLDGEWLQVTGGGRAATYLMTDQGLVPVRLEALRDGVIVLPTSAGDVALPGGAVVDFQNGSRALVTESGGTTPFDVEDGTFVRAGDTTAAPPPGVEEAGQAASVVDGDLAHLLDNGLMARPVAGGIGVFDQEGRLRLTLTPDRQVIVHGDPADPSVSAPVDVPGPRPDGAGGHEFRGLDARDLQLVGYEPDDLPPVSFTDATNQFHVMVDGRLVTVSADEVSRFVDLDQVRVLGRLPVPFRRGAEVTIPTVEASGLALEQAFSRMTRVEYVFTVPRESGDWRFAIARVATDVEERSEQSVSASGGGEVPLAHSTLVPEWRYGTVVTTGALTVSPGGELVDAVVFGRDGVHYVRGVVPGEAGDITVEPPSTSLQASAGLKLPGAARGGVTISAQRSADGIQLKVQVAAGTAFEGDGMTGRPGLKRTIELGTFDLPDNPVTRWILTKVEASPEMPAADVSPSDEALRKFRADLAAENTRALDLLTRVRVDPAAPVDPAEAADVAALADGHADALMSYLVDHPGEASLMDRVIQDVRAARHLAADLREQFGAASPTRPVVALSPEERLATVVDVVRAVAIPRIGAQWLDVADQRPVDQADLSFARRFAERMGDELDDASRDVRGGGGHEADRASHDLSLQLQVLKALEDSTDALARGDWREAARALADAHHPLSGLINTATQDLQNAAKNPATRALALDWSKPALDAAEGARRMAELVAKQAGAATDRELRDLVRVQNNWVRAYAQAHEREQRLQGGLEQVGWDPSGPLETVHPLFQYDSPPRPAVPDGPDPANPGPHDIQDRLTSLDSIVGRIDQLRQNGQPVTTDDMDAAWRAVAQAESAVRAAIKAAGDDVPQSLLDRVREVEGHRAALEYWDPGHQPALPADHYAWPQHGAEVTSGQLAPIWDATREPTAARPPLRTGPGTGVTLPGPRLKRIDHRTGGPPPPGGDPPPGPDMMSALQRLAALTGATTEEARLIEEFADIMANPDRALELGWLVRPLVKTVPGEVGMSVSTLDVPGQPAQGGTVAGPLQVMWFTPEHGRIIAVVGSTSLKVTAAQGGKASLGGDITLNPQGVWSPVIGGGWTATAQRAWEEPGAALLIVFDWNWRYDRLDVYAGVVPPDDTAISVTTEASHELQARGGLAVPSTGTALIFSGLVKGEVTPEGGRRFSPGGKVELKLAEGLVPGVPDVRFYAKIDGLEIWRAFRDLMRPRKGSTAHRRERQSRAQRSRPTTHTLGPSRPRSNHLAPRETPEHTAGLRGILDLFRPDADSDAIVQELVEAIEDLESDAG